MNTWNVEGGEGYLPDNEDPNKGGTVSNNKIDDAITGSAVSTATGMALSRTPAADVPGLVGVAAGAAGDLARGRNAGQIARNSGARAAKTVANYGLKAVGVPGYVAAPGLSIGMANVIEAQRDNPNYGRATVGSGIPSISATIGGLIAGPIGALVAGVVADAFTRDSLENGGLGDWTNSRTMELERDMLEDQWLSHSQSASAVANDYDLQSGYDTNIRGRDPNTFSNPNVTNYDPAADNPTQAPSGWRGGTDGSGFDDSATEDRGGDIGTDGIGDMSDDVGE